MKTRLWGCVLLIVLAGSSDRVFSFTGDPSLSGTVAAVGLQSAGTVFVDLRLTDNGTGSAQNILINQLQLRTLTGSGTVTHNTSLSPALPIAINSLPPGGSTITRLFFSVPTTVSRFSITENGTIQDSANVTYNFSIAEAVIVPANTPTPSLLTPNPNSGQQGQQNLSVNLTGQFTHWVQGTTTASFGAGITVATLTVNSATTATAVLNIDAAAAAGTRNVTVATGAEVVTLNNGFNVTSGTSLLLNVNPNSGQQGQQNLSVNLTGQFTHWVQGTTTASFGAGITVATLTVNSATTATAVLNIDAAAAAGTRNVTVATGAEVVTLNNGFNVTSGTSLLLNVNPNSGQQGQQNLSVNLTGQFTHWVQGTTTASFGAGITVATLTVNSATTATAVLNIDAAAAAGTRNVTVATGAEVVTLNNGFNVTSGTPGLSTVNPNSGQQGQQNLSVNLTGQFTHWVQGTSTASFGSGITIATLTVNSAITATAILNIDAAAATGARNVTLTTGTESVTLNNGFNVTSATPVLSTVNPNSGQQGQQNLSVNLTGQFTHWVQGTTTASFGSGITISTLTVNSATSATAVLNIDAAATTGTRNVTVTTGAEVVTLNNGFNVTSATPVLVTVNPNSGQQAQQNLSVNLTGQFTHWVQGTTTASFGAGTTVATLTVNSTTNATAVLNIDAAATTGTRNVTLTTGAESVTLNNGFNVTSATPVLVTVNPNSGQQGQQGLSVNLTGQFTHWVQGTTTASFGAGITIATLTVNSVTTATAVLNIDAAAATGFRDVTLTTGTEVVTRSNGFRVMGPTTLLFSAQPGSPVTVGKPFDPVRVTILDVNGQLFTGVNIAVTVSLGSSPAGAVLAGTLTQNTLNGVASFSDLSVNKVGHGYTLQASAGSLTATSTPFDANLLAAQLAACGPTSSHSVLAQGNDVVSYVANGFFGGGTKNIEVVPLEGVAQRATILTPNIVNSCASNWVTGQTVCTGDGTDVYLIQGSTLTDTLKSAANSSTSSSFGVCQNCGVALNAVTNQAVIPMGFTLPGGSPQAGIQILDLNTKTFSTPIPVGDSLRTVSEDILVDPNRSLVLSPSEDNKYNLFDLSGSPKVYQRNITVSQGVELDSAAEDCNTGIALSSEELSGNLFITDLTQATFNPNSSPPSWTAPGQSQVFPEYYDYAAGTELNAGTTGIAVDSAQHLGIVTGENGGNNFGVFQLPATSGSGIPAAVDYIVATLPNDPSGRPWEFRVEPHAVSTYDSPNDGKAYGVVANSLDHDRYLAIIDLQGLMTAPRSATHRVDATLDLVAAGLVRFVRIGPGQPSQLVFITQPASVVAGHSFPVQVAVEDAEGDLNVDSIFNITLRLSGSNASFSANVANGIASFLVTIQAAGSYTISASTSNLPTITSNTFTISPGPGAKLIFTSQPANITAGQPLPSINVAWLDQFNNPTPSALPITMALSANQVGAILSGTTTAVPLNGVATFTQLTVNLVGTFTLLASGNGVQATSGAFQVTNSTATKLSFLIQPATALAGQAMNLVQVVIEDAFGNIVNANNQVTMSLGNNPTGATLGAVFPQTTSGPASSGYASFYYLTVSFAGSGYTLVATSPGLQSATSAPFNIQGGGPPVTLSPKNVKQGATVSVTITASNTHFQQGVTQASFGPGTMVASGLSGGYGPVTVTSPTTAVAQVSASATSTPGLRTVVLKTGNEVETLFDSFEVVGTPFLFSVNPASATPGQTRSVTIQGLFTNFVQGTTQANFGPGISVGGGAAGGYGPVTVSSSGIAVAQVAVQAGAAVGLRTPISVKTGTELASFTDGGYLVLGTVIGPPPVNNFTSLTEGMEITQPTSVTGTISSPNLSTWTLDYAPAGSSSFTTFSTGTSSTFNGTLDPTLLLNGMITVRLTAMDQSGQTTSSSVNVVITRNQKVGNFTLSFTDMNIPVAGIPIQVVRTYDSRDKTVGDFGVGWTLSVKSFRVDVNGILGKNWIGTSTGGLLPTYCVIPGQNYVVSVRLQNGTVYQFRAVPTSDTQCGLVLPPQFVDLDFVPIGSTPASAQLTQPNSTGLMVSGEFPGPLQLVDPNTFEDYGFAGGADQWILTMPSGQRVQVSVTFGVQAIGDTNGNAISIGPNGITSTLGPAVTFTRDAQNRISGMRDPKLNLLQYAYDNNGNLTSVVNQLQNTSNFSYDSNHNLISYTDPTGAQPIRNVYDNSGRLIQQIDALGHVQNFGHDLSAHTETFTDFLGNTTTYIYDSHGKIIQEIDPLGNSSSKTFDANDNVLTETNALGKTTSYTYDANNNRLSVTDPLGNVTRFTYNALSEVLTTKDPNGNTISKTYDSAGNLLTLTDQLGNTTANTYLHNGLLETMTDALGNTTHYTYDPKGYLLSVSDPLGTAVNSAYDSNGNRVSATGVRTTATGQETLTTQYQYDGKNRLVKTTFPDGSVTQSTFNTLGQLSTTADGLRRQTTYSYDSDGHLLSTTYPDGTSETNAYDAVGNKVAFTDRSGATTTYAYDQLRRLIAGTDSLGGVLSTTYNAAGQKTSSTDPRGNITHFGYDAAGRQVGTTNALGEVTQRAFDGVGSLISSTDAAGHLTALQHDAVGHLTRITHPNGSIETIAYDRRGSITSRTDADGKTTQYAYDGLARLTSVTDALNHTTRYDYDQLGNRTSITDANGHVTHFQYDGRGRQTNRTLPGGQSETFSYDAAGQLTSHTDFNNKTTLLAYDSGGRLLSKTPDPSFQAPPVTYGYTVSGRKASMTDVSGTTTYNYDLLGRLISKQSPEGNITYSHDAAGNVISLQAGTPGITYTYDGLNRLASVSDSGSGTTSYSYDPVGNLQSFAYPNGVRHQYAYDSLNRLTASAVDIGGAQMALYSYALDPAGYRLSVAELGGRSVSYTYDAVYHLTSESISGSPAGPNGTLSYTYDPVGNRNQTASTVAGISSATFSYDAGDRLTDDTYDAGGNTIASGGIGNLYDFENRLIKHGSVSLVYDGDGNRVSETVNGVTTKYLIDDQNPTGFSQVIAESVSDGTTRSFVYGLARINQRQVVPGSPATMSFYSYDGHGSVRALSNPAGAITDTYDYDAFGNSINRTGTTFNNYLFAGEPFDPALGVYYNRARHYDQRRGRFWTLDTLAGNVRDPQSLHRYLYTGANPVNHLDPSGNQEDLGEELAVVEISAELDSVAVSEGTALTASGMIGVGDTILAVEADTALVGQGVPVILNSVNVVAGGLTAAQEATLLELELEIEFEKGIAEWALEEFSPYRQLFELLGWR